MGRRLAAVKVALGWGALVVTTVVWFELPAAIFTLFSDPAIQIGGLVGWMLAAFVIAALANPDGWLD